MMNWDIVCIRGNEFVAKPFVLSEEYEVSVSRSMCTCSKIREILRLYKCRIRLKIKNKYMESEG